MTADETFPRCLAPDAEPTDFCDMEQEGNTRCRSQCVLGEPAPGSRRAGWQLRAEVRHLRAALKAKEAEAANLQLAVDAFVQNERRSVDEIAALRSEQCLEKLACTELRDAVESLKVAREGLERIGQRAVMAIKGRNDSVNATFLYEVDSIARGTLAKMGGGSAVAAQQADPEPAPKGTTK